MHPGNSGLSGGAFTLTTITRRRKEKRQKEKEKKRKERKKEEKTDIFPAYHSI
ncbi:hypothetical protein X777_11538 [Ooceraea biroi]|uniref:Uncharacterized protein n=1 Tax=Ooceraea biroi TaxID=2015173 RepID=A0A026W206_OOCBI|nr:hypothetical protein X777_11538 [Ooceraea biroi]